MPEIFLGDLSEAKFFDLLKPLLTGKKTGILTIKGKEDGEIFLEAGNIVHAKTADSFGEEAFLTIMGWTAGKAAFEPDATPRERTIPIPTENLLLNWSYRKQEWERIRKVVHSSNDLFHLSLQNDSKDRNIKGEQWNVLALTDGNRTISEIAGTLGWDEFKTSKKIYQLVQAGLLEKARESSYTDKKIVGEDFFEVMEFELKKVMGPVAPFIIEDKLNEFGKTKGSLPEVQALSFIEAVGEEIPNEQKKNQFKKAMMESFSTGK
jgi:hypothetical protein